MAGGKLTPRQKMINLMYLVFIAMMALNMSKEVLSAFGLLNEKFEKTNASSALVNENLLQGLQTRAQDDPTRYKDVYSKAEKIHKLSSDFYQYLGELKTSISSSFKLNDDNKLPYEQMDKGDVIDYDWFNGDKYSEKGKEIIQKFKNYTSNISNILGDDVSYKFLIENLEEKFGTHDIKDSQGITKPYLDYHFKGFPAISSITKLSALQNDVREIEQEAYNLFLGNSLKQAASMKNYQAMVITDKSVYFSGESVKGKVVLGRYDKSTVPTEVVVNGSKINLQNSNAFSDGQVQLNTTASGLGEHKFTGHFTFMEDGKPVKVDILNSNYIVVQRPNTATIAADKMNVVYMGLDNPISASFAGIPNEKVNVSVSSGSLRKTADGKYVLRPAGARSVLITASGKLPDGKVVSDKKEFRIKPVPKPFGTIRGEYAARGPVGNLNVVTIGAKFDDFDFDVNLQVTQFTIIFPGIGSQVINGTKLNAAAQRMAERLKPGDVVRITKIKTKLSGVSLVMKDAADATYTIQ